MVVQWFNLLCWLLLMATPGYVSIVSDLSNLIRPAFQSLAVYLPFVQYLDTLLVLDEHPLFPVVLFYYLLNYLCVCVCVSGLERAIPVEQRQHIALNMPLWMPTAALLQVARIRFMAQRPERFADFLRFFASY